MTSYKKNSTLFGSPTIKFRELNSVSDLPGGDLLIAKEVLQHLPNAMIAEYLMEMKKKYKFSLVTNSVMPGANINIDISAGHCRPLKPYLPPFFARGAIVHKYGLFADGVYYGNEVFLMIGD